ncbi:MAG: putative permease [Herbinix sp.]|jgi:predicted permease|nr:putative permease [Herbinix sp.]
MELSILLFLQMLSMMLMILMGYAIVKLGVVKSEQSSLLSAITLYIIVPCMVIDAYQIDYSPEKLNGLMLAAGVAFLMHVVFILVSNLLGKIMHISEIEKNSLTYSNGGNLIVPLVSSLLGSEQIFYCTAFMTIQLFFLWTHAVSSIGGSKQRSIKKILTNPNILAVGIGLLLFFTNTKLPGILGTTVKSVGGVVGPVCMIMIGMIMAKANLVETFLSKRNWLICFGRLILYPSLMILLLFVTRITHVIPYAKDVLMILFLAIGAPVAATITQMASLFDNEVKHAGAINVMSVILSIITLPLMLELYQRIL